MFLIKILLLFVIKPNNQLITKNSNTFSSDTMIYKSNPKKTFGCDERFPLHDRNNTLVHKIAGFIEKKKLMDTLKDDRISINKKLEMLQDNSICCSNIYAGGLMDDFDYKEF